MYELLTSQQVSSLSDQIRSDPNHGQAQTRAGFSQVNSQQNISTFNDSHHLVQVAARILFSVILCLFKKAGN